MIALPEDAVTSAVNANVLLPPAAITAELVQVSTLLAALQFQSLPCGPPTATGPSATLSCAGNTSTTVTNPLLGATE